jgi:hypothetical protein
MKQQDFTSNDLETFSRKGLEQCYLRGKFESVPDPEREGFFEMVYEEGDWSYRDSFTGMFFSVGQEIVRYKGQPVWHCSYGGGIVIEDKIGDESFFLKELEPFLRESLIRKDPNSPYTHRGPKNYVKGDWRYENNMEGDINKFNGLEHIYYKGQLVFYHTYFGSRIIGR